MNSSVKNKFKHGDKVMYIGNFPGLHGKLGTIEAISVCTLHVEYHVRFEKHRGLVTLGDRLERPVSDRLITITRGKRHDKSV